MEADELPKKSKKLENCKFTFSSQSSWGLWNHTKLLQKFLNTSYFYQLFSNLFYPVASSNLSSTSGGKLLVDYVFCQAILKVLSRVFYMIGASINGML